MKKQTFDTITTSSSTTPPVFTSNVTTTATTSLVLDAVVIHCEDKQLVDAFRLVMGEKFEGRNIDDVTDVCSGGGGGGGGGSSNSGCCENGSNNSNGSRSGSVRLVQPLALRNSFDMMKGFARRVIHGLQEELRVVVEGIEQREQRDEGIIGIKREGEEQMEKEKEKGQLKKREEVGMKDDHLVEKDENKGNGDEGNAGEICFSPVSPPSLSTGVFNLPPPRTLPQTQPQTLPQSIPQMLTDQLGDSANTLQGIHQFNKFVFKGKFS